MWKRKKLIFGTRQDKNWATVVMPDAAEASDQLDTTSVPIETQEQVTLTCGETVCTFQVRVYTRSRDGG